MYGAMLLGDVYQKLLIDFNYFLMDSTLVSNLGTQTEKLSTGDSIVLLKAKLKQELKPWQMENGKWGIGKWRVGKGVRGSEA